MSRRLSARATKGLSPPCLIARYTLLAREYRTLSVRSLCCRSGHFRYHGNERPWGFAGLALQQLGPWCDPLWVQPCSVHLSPSKSIWVGQKGTICKPWTLAQTIKRRSGDKHRTRGIIDSQVAEEPSLINPKSSYSQAGWGGKTETWLYCHNQKAEWSKSSDCSHDEHLLSSQVFVIVIIIFSSMFARSAHIVISVELVWSPPTSLTSSIPPWRPWLWFWWIFLNSAWF